MAASEVFRELLLHLCCHCLVLRERLYLSVKVDFLLFQTAFYHHQRLNLRAQIARLLEHFALQRNCLINQSGFLLLQGEPMFNQGRNFLLER